jgi:hypothetical protein
MIERDQLARALADSDRAIVAALDEDAAGGSPDRGRRHGRKITPCDIAPRPPCGAKTRSGNPCRSPAVIGRARCRMHGGSSTGPAKGTRNALKHGIYSNALSADDFATLDRIELGTIDHEIKVARIRLRRALIEQGRQEAPDSSPAQFHVDEVKVTVGGPRTETEVRRVRRDYTRPIVAFIRLIAELELKRQQLTAGGGAGDPADIAQRINAALNQIDRVNGLHDETQAELEESLHHG